MAWTLAEVQEMQTNLKAKLLRLSLQDAKEIETGARKYVLDSIEQTKADLAEFDAIECSLQTPVGTGIAYASFSDPY